MTTWNRKINGLGPILDELEDDGSNFIEIRDRTAAFFIADKLHDHPDHEKFSFAVEMLGCAEDIAEFDEWLSEIYDWADDERIWIDPYEQAGVQ